MTYDLRPLLIDVRAEAEAPLIVGPGRGIHPELGTGRPEEVVAALGDSSDATLVVASIVRERLLLVDDLDELGWGDGRRRARPGAPGWLTETLYDDVRLSLKVERVVFDSRTEHQRLVVADSARFGRMFSLDGVTQLTMADEAVYHEMLAHVPILAHGAVADVGIVGGGDGGLVEEVLKHPGIERVTIAELDAGVIDFARTYLPDLGHGAFDDPRRVDRARRRSRLRGHDRSPLRRPRRRLDRSIGPGASLFTPIVLRRLPAGPPAGGIVVTQNGVPFFQPDELVSSLRSLARLFADATCYLGVVPTYIGGFMAFGWATDEPGIRQVAVATIEERFTAAGLADRDPLLHTRGAPWRRSPCRGSSGTSSTRRCRASDLPTRPEGVRRRRPGSAASIGCRGVDQAGRNWSQPTAWPSTLSAGRPRWRSRTSVPSPSAARSTSTVLAPGGTGSPAASQPQVKTTRRGGSTSTYVPLAMSSPL